MKIGRSYTFASAHHLPRVSAGHKCGRPHGHTYGLEVELAGDPHPTLGWLVDYATLDAVVKRYIVDALDHRDLNEIIENPTAENIVNWIWDRLSNCTWDGGVRLARIRLSESVYSWAERTE